MKILAFDTCFAKTYVVLSEDDKILTSNTIDTTDEGYHSVYLIPNIVEILNSHNLKIQDLDAIGVNIGPGSFTGIRISATIARVFAQSADLKLVGVPSLQILSKLNTSDKNSTVILDARKNKVYFARYDKDNNPVVEPQLVERDELKEIINSEDVIITDETISEYLKTAGIESINYLNNQEKIGEYLSHLTYKTLTENKEDNFSFAKLKPLYIQPPSITKPKEKNVL
ncbi:tRNA (adenosine(37)-N6)-threonylcarbamoyltransferase complex dimerization subunit type 1 TsaB [bacterium]|nr:tRNA (adenosine(37)-N6)-threonylcarbamoyltransferase complex dimerization subunit type 1 TsaB [bacterium]